MYSFFTHPSKVCMTYFEHMKLSLYFMKILWFGSIKAFIHAFIPDVYITSTSDLSINLQKTLRSAGCHK
uniref:Uncharacterized protein n=1 Tax=viral metagenome TaxID=1070528 RepID=A0A6C0KI14_9ZZZZ